MSQDELDELFGEEMSEVSQVEEEILKVSKFSDSEKEHNSAKDDDGAEEEEETIKSNSTVEISELTLATVQKPSNQGLIVR
jgi:hypothetical protein